VRHCGIIKSALLLLMHGANMKKRKSKFIFQVKFNSRIVYEALKSNSDGAKFIACNFMLHPITIIIPVLEYNSTDFPSHQS
jgi:hypothetical protein